MADRIDKLSIFGLKILKVFKLRSLNRTYILITNFPNKKILYLDTVQNIMLKC